MRNDRFDAIVIPDCLTQRVQQGIQQGEKVYAKNRRRRVIFRLTATAAALVFCVGVLASQPALAARIPVIRDIFKLLQDDYSYQGDLDAVARKFQEPVINVSGNEKKETAGDSEYTKTVDGVTVTVSEAYCSTEAIYLSLMITGEDAFPDTMLDTEGQPILCFRAAAEFSFRPNGDDFVSGSLEGRFLDAHTYAGIYRIDIQDIVGNDDALREKYRNVDAFDMDFCIEKIIGDKADPEKLDYQGKTEEDLEKMSDEEWKAFMNEITPPDWYDVPNHYQNWWLDGPFAFRLHIESDRESEQIVTIDEMNDTGAGLYQVVKTKFEITVQEKCSKERTEKGVFPVVLDAQGKMLSYGSSQYCNTFATDGMDVSKVYVYICDYEEYMDEIKRYRNDADYQAILEERALYGKEINF